MLRKTGSYIVTLLLDPLLTFTLTARRRAPTVSQFSPPDREAYYDIRNGAAGYAPIVGAFGALAVPTATFIFTSQRGPQTLTALAVGLVVVAMIGSLIGAVGLSAIGAERVLTANLLPAAMWVAIPVILSVVAVMASFEVLSAIYLPDSKYLFLMITVAAALCGIVFNSFSVGEAWRPGPADPVRRERCI